jgi:hypothetical protein
VYDLDHGDAKAMMAASGLLAKLTFINTPTMSENKPLSAENGPTSWVRSMQGVKTILSTPKLRIQLESSFMYPILQRYSQKPEGEVDVDFDKAQLGMGTLKELCETEQPSTLPNPYISVIARLEPLMLLKPKIDMVELYMAFIASLEASFIELLERNETRALLILSFWCARLPQVGQWWTGPSARHECRRICAHLSRVNDPRVQALLKYPAQSCGFELPDRKSVPPPLEELQHNTLASSARDYQACRQQ